MRFNISFVLNIYLEAVKCYQHLLLLLLFAIDCKKKKHHQSFILQSLEWSNHKRVQKATRNSPLDEKPLAISLQKQKYISFLFFLKEIIEVQVGTKLDNNQKNIKIL